jgi:subtilisin family serine protease
VIAQQDFNTARPAESTDKFIRMGNDAIAQHYIVVLDADVDVYNGDLTRTVESAMDLAFDYGGAITNIYSHALNGFSAQMTEGQALKLSQDPRVRFVEEDSVMMTNVTQSNPPSWGLDRIDETDLPLSNTYSYTTTGAGVNVYVIDTGIRRTHTQFGGRAAVGFDAVGDGQNTNDCNGQCRNA